MNTKQKKIAAVIGLLTLGGLFIFYSRRKADAETTALLSAIGGTITQNNATTAQKEVQKTVDNTKLAAGTIAIVDGISNASDPTLFKKKVVEIAMALHKSIDGWGTDEPAFFAAFERVGNLAGMKVVTSIYAGVYKHSLWDDIKSKWALYSPDFGKIALRTVADFTTFGIAEAAYDFGDPRNYNPRITADLAALK